jgi:predicted  nucleic acid-binding Zn-ribbon protein
MDEEEALREAADVGDLRTELAGAEAREACARKALSEAEKELGQARSEAARAKGAAAAAEEARAGLEAELAQARVQMQPPDALL